MASKLASLVRDVDEHTEYIAPKHELEYSREKIEGLLSEAFRLGRHYERYEQEKNGMLDKLRNHTVWESNKGRGRSKTTSRGELNKHQLMWVEEMESTGNILTEGEAISLLLQNKELVKVAETGDYCLRSNLTKPIKIQSLKAQFTQTIKKNYKAGKYSNPESS